MTLPLAIYVLAVLIAAMAGAASGMGLFWKSPGQSYEVVTHRGVTAQIFGQGLYRDDTVLIGAGFRAQDSVTLFLGCPLLLVAILLSAGGSMAGHLLLVGVLGYFLYVYASMAFGAFYNRLFLLYVALTSLSLFLFVASFVSVDRAALGAIFNSGAPIQPLAVFLIASGLITLIVWGAPLVAALSKNALPDRLDTYTTPVTYALDLAVITPSTIIAGLLLLRSDPLGIVIAFPLLVLIVLLVPLITLATLFQRAAGVKFTTAEMIGPVAGFVLLGVLGIVFVVALVSALA